MKPIDGMDDRIKLVRKRKRKSRPSVRLIVGAAASWEWPTATLTRRPPTPPLPLQRRRAVEWQGKDTERETVRIHVRTAKARWLSAAMEIERQAADQSAATDVILQHISLTLFLFYISGKTLKASQTTTQHHITWYLFAGSLGFRRSTATANSLPTVLSWLINSLLTDKNV